MILKLNNKQAREAACKAVMEAPLGFVFRLGEPRKTRDQEEKYHAMIGDIAKQYLFCERYWDREDMKRLLIDQFRRETAHMDEFKELWLQVRKTDLAPSLDGSGVVALGIQSRRFPGKLASAFIEFLNSFGDDNGVRWTEAQFDRTEQESVNRGTAL